VSFFHPQKKCFEDPEEGVEKFNAGHFFYDTEYFANNNTLRRVSQRINEIMAHQHHEQVLDPAAGAEEEDQDEIDDFSQERHYAQIFTVDYRSSGNPAEDQFICQTTFSYLNWRILDQVYEDDEVGFEKMDKAQVMEVSYCLFPRFKTALHLVLDKENLLNQIFQFA